MQHCTKLPLLLHNVRKYTADEDERQQVAESIEKVEASLSKSQDCINLCCFIGHAKLRVQPNILIHAFYLFSVCLFVIWLIDWCCCFSCLFVFIVVYAYF